MTQEATLTVPIQAGILIRKRVKTSLKNYCFKNELNLTIAEAKGLFDSDLKVTISGNAATVSRAGLDLKNWAKQIGA